MLDEIKYLGDQKFEFAEGRNFQTENYYEAVLGATVARKTGLQVGKDFRPTHDVGGVEKHKHKPFAVVGVLKPTGTPSDRAIFVNIEGFYRQPGHIHDDDEDEDAKPAKAGKTVANHEHEDEHAGPIPDKLKKVTAILVCLDASQLGRTTRAAARQINDSNEAQAAVPGDEIDRLFKGIVGDIQVVLLLFAIMIVVVAGIGIMVSIYNSMSDRRHEIAIMRALGASRGTIMAVILLESILLSLGGGALGLLFGHGVIALFSPIIVEHIGIPVNLLQFQATEFILIPALIVLASIVGYLPAVAAYRTDVARWLMSAP